MIRLEEEEEEEERTRQVRSGDEGTSDAERVGCSFIPLISLLSPPGVWQGEGTPVQPCTGVATRVSSKEEAKGGRGARKRTGGEGIGRR